MRFSVGDKVKCTSKSKLKQVFGGNDGQLDDLSLGKIYTIASLRAHTWHTKLFLKELDGAYNSVLFECEGEYENDCDSFDDDMDDGIDPVLETAEFIMDMAMVTEPQPEPMDHGETESEFVASLTEETVECDHDHEEHGFHDEDCIAPSSSYDSTPSTPSYESESSSSSSYSSYDSGSSSSYDSGSSDCGGSDD